MRCGHVSETHFEHSCMGAHDVIQKFITHDGVHNLLRSLPVAAAGVLCVWGCGKDQFQPSWCHFRQAVFSGVLKMKTGATCLRFGHMIFQKV